MRSNRSWDSEVKAPGGEEHKENKIIKQKISHLIHCRLLRQWTVMLLMMLGLMAKEKERCDPCTCSNKLFSTELWMNLSTPFG